MARTLSLLSLAAAAAAQWTPSGLWEKVQLSANQDQQQVPASNIWRRSATTGGAFIVTAGSGAGLPGSNALSNMTYQYDHATNIYSAYPVLPPTEGLQGFTTFTYAGYVCQANPTSILFWDTATPLPSGGWQVQNQWTQVTLSIAPQYSAPQTIYAGRVIVFGSTLYYFGGANGGNAAFNNGLWSLDMSTVITTGLAAPPPLHLASVGWVNLVAPGIPNTVLTPTTYPCPRGDFAFETVGSLMVMFGGWNPRDPANNNARMHYSDVWGFMPGNLAPAAPVDPSAAGIPTNPYIAAFRQLPVVPGNGIAVVCTPSNGNYNNAGCGLPAGRGGHAHGMYGDNLFIYGGFGDAPPAPSGLKFTYLSDMWILNLPSNQWFSIPQLAPYPQPVGFTAGIVSGRHFYLQISTCPFTFDTPPACGASANELWRWSTPITSGPGRAPSAPAAAAPASDPSAYTAHSWGLAIGILVGLFNTYVLVLLANNSTVDILGSFKGVLGMCGMGGGAPAPTPGFYANMADKSGDTAGYAAPPA